jgi:hypothetical protein
VLVSEPGIGFIQHAKAGNDGHLIVRLNAHSLPPTLQGTLALCVNLTVIIVGYFWVSLFFDCLLSRVV